MEIKTTVLRLPEIRVKVAKDQQHEIKVNVVRSPPIKVKLNVLKTITEDHLEAEHSIERDGNTLRFVNDQENPGEDRFYGTDENGQRTWLEQGKIVEGVEGDLQDHVDDETIHFLKGDVSKEDVGLPNVPNLDTTDAVNKAHDQNTDAKLDEDGDNEVSAEDLRSHLDNEDIHREIDDDTTSPISLWSSEKIQGELDELDASSWKEDGEDHIQPKDGKLVKVEHIDGAVEEDIFNNHSARHESGGDDEINVEGLSGELEDPQKPKTHGNDAHDPAFASDQDLQDHIDDKNNPHETGLSNLNDYDADGNTLGNVNAVKLNPLENDPTFQEGLLWLNGDLSIPAYYDETGARVFWGQDNFKGRNTQGAAITRGQAVYVSGSTGDLMQVKLGRADTKETSRVIALVASASINNNANGRFFTEGRLSGINTSSFAVGDSLWLSTTSFGAYTNVKPSYPNFAIHLGKVVRSHATQGAINIQIYEDCCVYDEGSVLFANGDGRIAQDPGNFDYDADSKTLSVNDLEVGGGETEEVEISFIGAFISKVVAPVTAAFQWAFPSKSGTIALTDDIPGAKNSIEEDDGDFQLVGDEETPGNDKVYGTDEEGNRGWFDQIVSKSYLHNQSVASDTWNVNHQLGDLNPVIAVYSPDNILVEPEGITIVDEDNLTISFGEDVTGKAKVIA